MSGGARAAAAHGAASGTLFTLHAALQDADVGGGAHALDDVHDLGRWLLAQPVRAEPALRARDGHAGAEAGVEVEDVQQLGLLLRQLLRAQLRLGVRRGRRLHGRAVGRIRYQPLDGRPVLGLQLLGGKLKLGLTQSCSAVAFHWPDLRKLPYRRVLLSWKTGDISECTRAPCIYI
jgi:hypothetical protein